jgi:hypothetical protein
MMKSTLGFAAALALCVANTALAQAGLPTSQPNLLQIYREEVKVGHNADHEKVEVGWPAAFEKVKSPYYYIALVSLTGSPEAWFVSPFESHQAQGESMKLERGNAVLSAELARLQRADADHLTGARSIQAVARKELSHGDYPDTAKQRFWEVTIFRLRPGHEEEFNAAAKAYGAAITRSGATTGFRVYQVIAGMPTPTYLIFSSVTSYADFDKMMSDDQTIMKAFTPEDQKLFQKFFTEGMISADTQRFELNPAMSYVSAEVRATDPEFWMPKKKPATKTTPSEATKPGGGKPAAKPGSR